MSHISKIELEVNDLGMLGQACKGLGLELIRNQKSFKWYGQDSKCDHAINVPDASYEIGIVKNGNGYELQCDFYDHALGKVIGVKGGLLKQAYALQKTRIEARRKGYSVLEKWDEDKVRLHIRVN